VEYEKDYGRRRVQKKQTAREKFINEGDENTMFFHLIAKGRKRRVKIPFLIHEGASVNDSVGINKVASAYYKDLFGPSDYSSVNVPTTMSTQAQGGGASVQRNGARTGEAPHGGPGEREMCPWAISKYFGD
jgi:hypothetical protein